MDRNSALDYVEKGASTSIADTKEFIKYVRQECCEPSSAVTMDDSVQLSPPGTPRRRQLSGHHDTNLTSLPSLKTGSNGDAPLSPMSPPSSALRSPGSPPKSLDYHYQGESESSSRSSRKNGRSSVSSVSSSSSTTSSTARSQAARHAATALVQPILTPRFAISCSDALMAGLQAMVGKGKSRMSGCSCYVTS
jgi:guanine deaminase